MKKLAAFAVLLSLAMFSIGCQKAADDTAPAGDDAAAVPADDAAADAPADEAPADEAPATE